MFTADNTKSYILVSKLTFRALALCQSEGRNCELCVCVCLYAENGATLLVGIW